MYSLKHATLTAVALFSLSIQSYGSVSAPTVEDIGVLGLLSHDIFGWDARKKVNTDNGRLDLSTIFDFNGGSAWATGGNPKNSENAMVYTITMKLVDKYTEALAQSGDSQQARIRSVNLFREMVRTSFERVTGESFPNSTNCSDVNHQEQAAFRALHDMLPGAIALDSGSVLYVTDYRTARTRLSAKELSRTVPNFNGEYDQAYLSIAMPGNQPPLNLKEADRNFIETNTAYRQEDLLIDLGAVGAGSRRFSEVSFYGDFVSAFRKAGCVDSSEVSEDDVTSSWLLADKGTISRHVPLPGSG